MDGNVVTSTVDDFDDEGVAVSDLQSGPRELPVDSDYVVSSAQPLHWSCLNLKIVFNKSTLNVKICNEKEDFWRHTTN